MKETITKKQLREKKPVTTPSVYNEYAVCNNSVYLSKVNHLRILKNVIPGDQLVIKADLVQHKMNSFKFNAICTVEDEVVAKSEFLATLVKK